MANIETMFEECEAAGSIAVHNGGTDFTDWEREFLESAREQHDRRGRLTDRQAEILTEIHGKI